MSNVLTEMLEKFESIQDDIQIFGSTLMQSDEVNERLLNYNRAQMYAGKRSDGSDIEPEYHPVTVDEKRKKGDPSDRVTLNDEDDFYEGLRTKNLGNETDIYGTDFKTPALERKYNAGDSEILGVTEENLEELKEEILLPDFLSFVNNYFK